MKRSLLVCFTLAWAIFAHAQERSITGKVKSDTDGSAVPGANVVLKGSTNGTVTDADGNYKMTVPSTGGTLVVSFIGMQTMEMEIGEKSNADFSLLTDVRQLTEVVVTAMNVKVDKDKFASAVSTVTGNAVVKSGETSVITGMTGKAAGVLITRSGGDPGAGAYIQIRGQNTINGNSQPLIVIDGIPMSNTSEGSAGVMQQSRLNDLNPSDIESMEILKSASAAAIWGTRAANGVIMITTKKGKNTNGKISIEFKSTVSLDKINKMHPLQTAYGQGVGGKYNGSVNRIWGDKISDRTGGADTPITDAGYVTFPDGSVRYPVAAGTDDNVHGGKNSTQTWDHTNDVFRTGYFTDNSLGISGGTDKSNFYLGIANLNQKGVIKAQSDYKRNGVRFNFSNNLTDWMRVSVNSNYVNVRSNRVQQGDNTDGLLLGMLRTPGDFNNAQYTGTYTNADGESFPNRHVSYRNPLGAGNSPGFANPIWNIHNLVNTTNVDRMIGNVQFDFDPTKWLNITARSGVDNFTDKRIYDYPVHSANYPTGHLEQEYIIERQFNNDLFARVTKQLGSKFNLGVLAGVNYNNRYKERLASGISTFIIPDAPPLLSNALKSNITLTNETYLIRSYGYYAQVNFDAFDQVFFEFTGRNESASTFGAKAKGSFFFPSGAVAWQFTKLPGLQNGSFLSFGKLRATYGSVGIQPNAYLTTTPFNSASYTDAYAEGVVGSSGLYRGGYLRNSTYGNEFLKPERKEEFELGTDLRFFNDNLTLGITVYKSDTRDVLLQLPVAPTTGYSSSWQNAAHLSNKGIEIELGYNVINTPDFQWRANANYSMNRNNVVSLAGTEAQTFGYASAYVEGHPIGTYYGLDFKKNADGTYVLDENGFAQGGTTPGVIGNSNPKWRGGISNTFTYNGFTVSGLFDAVQGNQGYAGARGALYNYGTHADVGHERVSDVDLKTNTGDIIPAGTPFRGNIHDFGGGPVALTETWYNGGGGGAFDGASDKQFIKNASTVRLREVSLSYVFRGAGFKKATGLTSIELTATGRNLALWSPWVGVDPESNTTQAASQARGEDWFTNPNTKSYLFSVRLNY
ncbi:MAG: SusC/RagA family TonB-linked outer membrane protein [Chryseolinea sp.]